MNILEVFLVGKTPLGSALRAGIIGCLATTLGTMFFIGTMYPLIFGLAVVLILLPVVYAISKRDNPESEPAADPMIAANPGSSVPQTGEERDAGPPLPRNGPPDDGR